MKTIKPSILVLLALLGLAACAAKVKPVEREPPPPARVAKPPRSVSQEPLRGKRGSTTDELPPPGPATEPPAMLASIGPSTTPQRTASVRLTDEGRRLLEKGDTAAALDRIESAVKIDSSNPHAYYWLAQVHLRNGRLDQALAYADKSIVLFNQSDRPWLGQAYALKASVLERLGRFPDARAAYRRAVQAEPGNVAARAGLARVGDSAAAAP